MDQISKLIRQLTSTDKNKRYDACELLRVSPTLPPEAISALQVATHDSEEEVAEAAQRALAIHLAPGPAHPRQAPLSGWAMPPLDLSDERLAAIVRKFQTRLRWYYAAFSVAIPSMVGLMVSIRKCDLGSAAEAPLAALCAPFLSCAAPFLGLPAPAWLVLLAAAAAVARLNFRCPNCGHTPRDGLMPKVCATCRVPLQPASLRDYIDFTRERGAT